VVPTVLGELTFYDRHYSFGGNILLSPAQALETYRTVINPTTGISALWWITQQVLALPRALLADSATFAELLATNMRTRLPLLAAGTTGIVDFRGESTAQIDPRTGTSPIIPSAVGYGDRQADLGGCSSLEGCTSEWEVYHATIGLQTALMDCHSKRNASCTKGSNACAGGCYTCTSVTTCVTESKAVCGASVECLGFSLSPKWGEGRQAQYFTSAAPNPHGPEPDWTLYTKRGAASAAELSLLPGEFFRDQGNSENPELYAVHPFRLLVKGAGDGNASAADAKRRAVGVTTFRRRVYAKGYGEWQNVMQAANLGLRDDAASLVAQRASFGYVGPGPGDWREGTTDHLMRFPLFVGEITEDRNWYPDMEQLASMRMGLQAMLLRNDGESILLFAAWPTYWPDVDFKLAAYNQTTVECSCRHNEVVSLVVTPAERLKDVVFAGDGCTQPELNDVYVALKSDDQPVDLDAKADAEVTAAVTTASGGLKLLFIDSSLTESTTDGIELRLHRPTKAGFAIKADKPWEPFGMDVYSTVVKDPHNETWPWRMYYAAAVKSGFQRHFMAVAFSRDGIEWIKPELGIVKWGGYSTNFVFPTDLNYTSHYQLGNVFYDERPGTPLSERWVHVAHCFSTIGACPNGGLSVFFSSDGISWDESRGASTGVVGSDTFNVAFWDNKWQSYVGFIRIDAAHPFEHGSRHCQGVGDPTGTNPEDSDWATRRIGRCSFDSLHRPWGCQMCANSSCSNQPASGPPGPEPGCNCGGSCCTNQNASTVLSFDETDPVCMDYYTNAATIYDNIYLFFPSAFSHTVFAYDQENDGLLDIRFAASRDGLRARPVPAVNGRSAWIPQGVNRCIQMSAAISEPTGLQWCDKTAQLATTSPDTGSLYMTQGFVRNPDGERLHLYYGADPMSHSGYELDNGTETESAAVFRNRGIMRVDIRVDGYASYDAGYHFPANGSREALPQLLTRPLTLPTSGCRFPPVVHQMHQKQPQNKCVYGMPGDTCTSPWEFQRCGPSHSNLSCGKGTCQGKKLACNSSGYCTGGDNDDGAVCTKGTPRPYEYTTGGLTAFLNFQSSVVGLVFVELQTAAGAPILGYSLAEADPTRGNFIAKAVTWRGGTSTLKALAGQTVRFRVVMTDASLFSIDIRCEESPLLLLHQRRTTHSH
jgi:hypothetical protein